MKKIFLVIVTFAVTGSAGACGNRGADPVAEEPLPRQIHFGDPFIFLHEGVYYMYGTSAEEGIEVYCSQDLLHWEGPCGTVDGLALHKDDVWGEKWFWAPEVYYLNGQFYMYLSAEEHLIIATSGSPLGPFKQAEKKPLLESKAIDHHLFIDDDGKPYLFFVNFGENGLSTWVAEMHDDLLSMKKETRKPCIKPEQTWELVEGRVNEGPYVLKHNHRYYLFYSGNGYTSQNYGVGFAVADNPTGPWTKYEGNPILQSPDTLRGTGHGAFFRDKKDRLHYVYHAHNSQSEIHPRKVYFNACRFTEKEGVEYPVLEIQPPRQVPVIK